MASSAFKSTTRRASLAGSPADSSSSSSSFHRRARSLSRLPRGAGDDEPTPAPRNRGRFVNTVRRPVLPEISLDDLAIELFDSSLRERSASRIDDVTPGNGKGGENVNHRRGRSVSRQESRVNAVNSGVGGRLTSDTASSRRRRSVSVVRYQISDSESDLDHSQNSCNRASMKSSNVGNNRISSAYDPTVSNNRQGLRRSLSQKDLKRDLDHSQNSSNRASMKSSNVGNNPISSAHKPSVSNNRQGLRRSLSQKDLKYHDGYSSRSSVITDDELRDAALSNKNGTERTIRAVYAQKKGEHPIGGDVNGGLYAAMRKELRHAVEEIKAQLQQSMVKTKKPGIATGDSLQPENSYVNQAVSAARSKFTTKLEKSEKRRQDLLTEILLQQHGRELSKIFKELLPEGPEPKNTIVEKPLKSRKRSNDRYRMSRQLTEEAEKYIEDFISNVEDTDISSLDGDSSDTSSSIGGMTKTPISRYPAVFNSVPIEMDGVMLPWLRWEASNDGSPLSCKNKHNLSQEVASAQDLSDQLTSSNRGSWSPEMSDRLPSKNVADQSQVSPSNKKMMMKLDLDDYLKPDSDEAFLLEMWSQRHGIHSGKLLLCNHIF